MATGGAAWFLSPWCRHTVQQSGQCSLHITRVAGVTKHGTTTCQMKNMLIHKFYVLMLSVCCRARWMLLSHGVRFRPTFIPALSIPFPLPPYPYCFSPLHPSLVALPCPLPSYSSPSPAPLPYIPLVTRSSSRCPPCFRTHPPAPLLSSLLVIVTAV